MGNIKLSSILLFCLAVPFIMTYRIGPGDTPFWLFAIIFLTLLVNIVVDLLKMREIIYYRTKFFLLWLSIIAVIGSAFVSAMIVRHQTHPIYMIHDIVLQQESAIRFFLNGKNPYAATYFGTPLEEWHYSDKETNPALYHFVMQPFYLLFALPFYFLSNHTIGYFDGRMPLLFLFVVLLITAFIVVQDREKKLLFVTLLAFNPAMLGYTLEGRSDIFMFAFLIVGLFLMQKGRFALAGVPTALAFAVKQSAWPLFPFYVAFLWFKLKNIKKVIISLIPFVVSLAIMVLPFYFWGPKAFLDSTVFYLSGNIAHSYPISGYGFGALMRQLGFIENVNVYYPFHIWQIIICLPLLVILTLYLRKAPSVQRMILVYGIFLFVYWYFSRYFNNSHLGYLSIVFITAYFFPEKQTDT